MIQTKGLSLEEINGKFGDEVIVYLTHTSEKESTKLGADTFEYSGRKETMPPSKDDFNATHREYVSTAKDQN